MESSVDKLVTTKIFLCPALKLIQTGEPKLTQVEPVSKQIVKTVQSSKKYFWFTKKSPTLLLSHNCAKYFYLIFFLTKQKHQSRLHNRVNIMFKNSVSSYIYSTITNCLEEKKPK